MSYHRSILGLALAQTPQAIQSADTQSLTVSSIGLFLSVAQQMASKELELLNLSKGELCHCIFPPFAYLAMLLSKPTMTPLLAD